MLNAFRYIQFRTGTPKTLPLYNSLLHAISELSRVRKYRYNLEPATDTNSIRFLTNLVSSVDQISLHAEIPDVDWYTDYFMTEYGQLRQLFDPIVSNRVFRNTFYHNLNRPREYIIPVDYARPLETLPFDQPWDNTWHQRQPLTLFFHDSNELVLHLRREEVAHRYDPPSLTLIGLNLPLLLLKYRAYRRSSQYQQQPTDLATFFHNEVIYGFHNQLIDLWLLNLISDLVTARYEQRSYMVVLEQYRRTNVPSNLKQALVELTKLVDNVLLSKIKFNDFLVTPLLYHKSLYSYLTDQNDYLQISPLRQYFYLQFLRDFSSYKLLIMLMQPTVRIGQNERYLQQLKLYLARIAQTNIHRIPGNPEVYDLISSKFDYLSLLLR